jgi:hypothetical protein
MRGLCTVCHWGTLLVYVSVAFDRALLLARIVLPTPNALYTGQSSKVRRMTAQYTTLKNELDVFIEPVEILNYVLMTTFKTHVVEKLNIDSDFAILVRPRPPTSPPSAHSAQPSKHP